MSIPIRNADRSHVVASGFRAPVWQKGFSEIRVYEREAYLGMREYIHANPVKRFLVVKSADYLYRRLVRNSSCIRRRSA
jgi:hypothetical protein